MELRRSIKRRERVIRIYEEDFCFVKSLSLYKSFCAIPYEGHPKGCDMRLGKKNCDGAIRKNYTWDDFFTREGPTWALYETFDIDAWEKEMHKKWPKWTKKQCRNARLWQGHLKKVLNDRVKEFVRRKNLWGKYAAFVDGFCLNFYVTMKRAGLPLDPMSDLHHIQRICILGKYKKGGVGERLQKKEGRQLIIY